MSNIKLLLPHDVLGPPNQKLLTWLKEDQRSWVTLFVDTFFQYDDAPTALWDYFDAIFSDTDWEWINQQTTPFVSLIDIVLEEYLAFRERAYPYLSFIHDAPVGLHPMVETIQLNRIGLLLTITYKGVSGGKVTL